MCNCYASVDVLFFSYCNLNVSQGAARRLGTRQNEEIESVGVAKPKSDRGVKKYFRLEVNSLSHLTFFSLSEQQQFLGQKWSTYSELTEMKLSMSTLQQRATSPYGFSSLSSLKLFNCATVKYD